MNDQAREQEPSGAADPNDDKNLMDHEYDGIQEFDNPLPRWWVWIFWGSFFFAVGYFIHYHVAGTGQGRIAAYEQEMKSAPITALPTATEESLAQVMADASKLETGKSVYANRCMACHGDKGQGLVGPNLTDNRWIHGQGKLTDIYQTVAEGVPAKGMPEWQKQLTPDELMAAVAFVGTLRGKNEAGKPPEGNEVKTP